MTQCSKCGAPNFQPRVSVNSDKIQQQLRSLGFADKASVDELLHDAEKDFDAYDAEIARLETAISVLKHKRRRLEGHVAKYRSLLSPIRRLPPEILGLVFLLCCQESRSYFDLCDGDITLPAVVLSQVCTSWRQVASKTSSIWSHLHFELGWLDDRPNHLKQKFIEQILPLINLYFERSSQVSLDLGLRLRSFMGNHDLESILKMITSTSHRWNSLYVWGESDSETKVFWSQITELSRLEYFETDFETLAWLLGISQNLRAHRLRWLYLEDNFPELHITIITAVPLAQITTLSLSTIGSRKVFEILRRCINLSELVMSDIRWTHSHLSLHVTKPTFRPETLNKMVRSRWIPDPTFSSEIGVACLRSIKLIGDERAAKKPSLYNSLMELEKFGLRVEIF
ncbi:hypothetical protein K435DRAFT_971825 [Dendrothele bispora CBS 962.96]|uniref:F-box domain-containing protein n=1 Tax=Dendrothele bispora (strain CBS 962.96) TaxID=1314807 RepID=A0A4S8L2V6_DENBC|nr:hypothetical protein K435DRAFT_971825 [Dendrothele bispora CBS 962.96]